MTGLALAALAASGSGLIAAVVNAFSSRGTRTGPDAQWDEDCPCCQAGCGETDEENKCLICQH